MLLNTGDLQVQASTRTGSGDAKQVDFRAHSASIKGSQCSSCRLTGVTGMGDVAPGCAGEMSTGWSVSQGVSQQFPECCLTALIASSVTVPLLRGGAHCRSEADKGLRIPSPVLGTYSVLFWGHPACSFPAHPWPRVHLFSSVICARLCTPLYPLQGSGLQPSTLGPTPAHFVLCPMYLWLHLSA